MYKRIYKKLIEILSKILYKIRPRFSFHYIAYTILFFVAVFSVVQLTQATTPNPGHPWSELGDGVFTFTSGQTATPYTYTFPAANTTVLTTNAAVTIAQGGLGGTTALQSVRRNATDTAFEAYTPATSGDISGRATTALDNLASVAINTALIPGTAGALDLGSTAKPWGSIWIAGTSGTPGTNQFKITGASNGGLRTITLPNASITVNAAADISGTTLASNVVTSSLTTVGALASGSIASGFGSISISNNISTTGAGTITSAGLLTASNGFTLTTGTLTLPNNSVTDAMVSDTLTASTATKATNLAGGNSTTLLGSIPYQSNTDTTTLLAPNTTTTKEFLRMTGTGTNGAAPVWDTVTATDVGLGNVTNESKATMFTSPTFTGTVAGFTMGGNLAMGANNITSTGSLGTTGSRLTKGWFTDLEVTGTIIGSISGAAGSATKATNLVGGNSTTLLGAMPYQSNTDTTTLLAPNTTTTKKFLSMTGTGTNGAVPVWEAVPSGAWDTIGDPSGNGDIAMGSTVQTMDWATATTTNPLSLTAASLTTGKLLNINSNSLTSGTLLDITSAGTGALTNQKGLNIALSGTNATSLQTTYGAYISNTHAGTTSTNVGLYATASGGTTANYAAIFNGGNVGIGTTNPGANLHVKGDTVGVQGMAITQILQSGIDGATGLSFFTNAGLNAAAFQFEDTSKSLYFYTNIGTVGTPSWQTRMTFTNAGNIGIGTTSPNDGNLEIASDIPGITGVAKAQMILKGTTDPNKQLLLGFETTNNYAFIQPLARGTSWSGYNLSLVPVGGYVGVGTAGPTTKLDIVETTYNQFSLRNGNQGLWIRQGFKSDGGAIPVADANNVQFQSSGSSTGSFSFTVGNNEAMRILSNGNVGIGTTDPSFKHRGSSSGLTTTKLSVISNLADDGMYIGNTNNNNTALALGSLNASSEQIRTAMVYSNMSVLTDGSEQGDLSFWTNGGTGISQKMEILPNGNVGIGTVNPLSKLSIDGGLHVGGDSDAGDNNLLVDGTITSTGNIIASSLTASKVVFTDASKNLTSTGIGTSSQFIKGDGSLDPSTYLTSASLSGYVPYTGATGAVTLGANTLSTTSGLISPKIYPSADSTTAFQINKADGTTNVLNVDTTNGRVGVGTTSPGSLLQVMGNTSLTGGVGVVNIQNQTSTGIALYAVGTYTGTTNSATDVVQGLNGFAATDASSTGNLTLTAGGGGLRNRYFISHSGSGAVSQASAVSAKITESGGTITDAADFHAETPTISSGKTLTNFYGLWVRGGSVAGTLTNRYGVYIDDLVGGTNRYGVYQVGSTDSNYFAGNVGIGTTSPGNNKLSVQQTSTVDGSVAVYGNHTGAITGIGYGGYFTKTGTSTTNVGLYSSASGATNNYAGIFDQGKVLIGLTSETATSSKLYIDSNITGNGSSTAIAGIYGDYGFSNGGTADYVQVGNRFVVTNSPTTNPNTAVGELIRIVDATSLANTVYGLNITANAGGNNQGVNTGVSSVGATFGVQGITSGLGGGVSVPAGLYGQNTGTTQGDVLRLYTDSMTSAPAIATFYHETSTFTGTGLLMDFATGSGSFTGNFVDFQKNNASLFKVTNAGITSLGLPINSGNSATSALCSTVANGTSPTAGTAYEVRDCSGSPVADYAEMYPVASDISYGDIVITGDEIINTYDVDTDGNIDWNKVKGNITKLVKSNTAYQSNVIGIVSNNKGDFSSTGYNIKEGDNPMPIALSGRVPVKISSGSQPIKAGDYITTSQDPGKATKAEKAGFIIGKALEDWNPTSEKKTLMVYVEQGFYNGVSIKNFAGINIDSNGDNNEFASQVLEKLLAVQSNQENPETSLSEILTDRLVAGLEIITPSIATNKLSVKGETTLDGLVYFNADAEFAKSIKFNDTVEFALPPLFNNDTGGFASIKQGGKEVRITFDNPYIATPVVNTTIAFNKTDNYFDKDSFFSDDIKSIVVDNDETGFTIALNKVAPQDVNFSWTALSVKDPKIFEGVIDGLVIDDGASVDEGAQEQDTAEPDATQDQSATGEDGESADATGDATGATGGENNPAIVPNTQTGVVDEKVTAEEKAPATTEEPSQTNDSASTPSATDATTTTTPAA